MSAGIVTYGANRFEVQQDGRRVAVFDRYSDAVLFVAAPELLEALQDIATAGERHGAQWDAATMGNVARAAIAKAEGGAK